MTLQELEANFRALQAKGDELRKQAKAFDAQISAANRRYTEAMDSGDTAKQFEIDEEIEALEAEQKRISKLAIHELNAANAALTAWKKAEKEQ